MRVNYFWKAVTNHSQAASPLGEHSSVVFNYRLRKGRNYEKLGMHLIKSKHVNIAHVVTIHAFIANIARPD